MNGLHMASEQDIDSAADSEALPLLEPKVQLGGGRPPWRPAAAGLLLLLVVLGVARGGGMQGGALESLLGLASVSEGTIAISAVGVGGTRVEVEQPGLFNVGDNITILNTVPNSEKISMENVVALVDGNYLVLRDPVERVVPEYSFIVARQPEPEQAHTEPASQSLSPASITSLTDPAKGTEPHWYWPIASTLFAVATCCMCCMLAGKLVTRPREATTIRRAGANEADSSKLITRTTFISEAGQIELRVETTDGFCSGDKVLISSDRADEYGIIRCLEGGDIMVLVAPLQRAHPAAAVISAPGRSLTT